MTDTLIPTAAEWAEFLASDFFSPSIEFTSAPQRQTKPRGGRARQVVLAAGLAAAVAIAGGAEVGGPRGVRRIEIQAAQTGRLVSARTNDGAPIMASANDILASIPAGHKATKSAAQLIEAGLGLGEPPARVVGIERGGVAVYWFSREKLSGGGSARFALFECEKNGTHLTLSDHTPEGVQVFEVKHANREEMVNRALSHTA